VFYVEFCVYRFVLVIVLLFVSVWPIHSLLIMMLMILYKPKVNRIKLYIEDRIDLEGGVEIQNFVSTSLLCSNWVTPDETEEGGEDNFCWMRLRLFEIGWIIARIELVLFRRTVRIGRCCGWNCFTLREIHIRISSLWWFS
jgi:hypothetical protein